MDGKESVSATGAIKRDATKPRMSLIARSMLWGIAQVMTQAVRAGKYPAHNWRKGLDWSTCFDSLMRHLWDWWEGLESDPDSGLHPLFHAACDLMFLIEYSIHGYGRDDRFKHPRQGDKDGQ